MGKVITFPASVPFEEVLSKLLADAGLTEFPIVLLCLFESGSAVATRMTTGADGKAVRKMFDFEDSSNQGPSVLKTLIACDAFGNVGVLQMEKQTGAGFFRATSTVLKAPR